MEEPKAQSEGHPPRSSTTSDDARHGACVGSASESERSSAGQHGEDPAELVIGLVAPVGTNKNGLVTALREFCEGRGYVLSHHRVSGLIEEALEQTPPENESRFDRSKRLMKAGNELRGVDQSTVGLLIAQSIRSSRGDSREQNRIHLVDSLKNPAEVHCLRRFYRRSFYLVSLHSPKVYRSSYLTGVLQVKSDQAELLISRDEKEAGKHQQRTSDTFAMGDVYFNASQHRGDLGEEVERFLLLVHGHPFLTPTQDEIGMFHAFSASLRSASLSRQVGASILGDRGDLVAVGCNEVPTFGGGLYWPGGMDQRDFRLLEDSNDQVKNRILRDVVRVFRPSATEEEINKEWRAKLRNTGLPDLTEFGRDVHAEMEALLSAARNGSGTIGRTLYTTTFPCHNCAKHIVAAGIKRVVYIEPYPKSRADQLHSDAITIDPESGTEVLPFEAFVGVGPRRFFDLFSLTHSSGRELLRKESPSGRAVDVEASLSLRTPELDFSTSDYEAHAANELESFIEKAKRGSDGEED